MHNTYFTLPVLFIMISNHYPMTYSHEQGWLVLIAIMIAGALIRQYFVMRHSGRANVGHASGCRGDSAGFDDRLNPGA